MLDFPVHFTLKGKTAILLQDFTLAGVTVPAGFESDGITSPRITWVKWHPFSKPVPAAFVHDYCIAEYGYAYARDKFKQALKELGLPAWEVRALYCAVRFKDYLQRQYQRLRGL